MINNLNFATLGSLKKKTFQDIYLENEAITASMEKEVKAKQLILDALSNILK